VTARADGCDDGQVGVLQGFSSPYPFQPLWNDRPESSSPSPGAMCPFGPRSVGFACVECDRVLLARVLSPLSRQPGYGQPPPALSRDHALSRSAGSSAPLSGVCVWFMSHVVCVCMSPHMCVCVCMSHVPVCVCVCVCVCHACVCVCVTCVCVCVCVCMSHTYVCASHVCVCVCGCHTRVHVYITVVCV